MATSNSRTTCTKGHVCPDLQQIIRTFELQDKNVLNVYIVGSHLWETCHKGSDWDLIVVVEKLASPKPLNAHKGNFEAFIISKEDYTQLIREHSMQVLVTLWMPRELVLREKLTSRLLFSFDKATLLKSLDHSRERDLRIAEKHFRKADSKKANKVLLHCIRYLVLGTQVKKTGSIEDYTAASIYRETILESYVSAWEDVLQTLQPILDELWTELSS